METSDAMDIEHDIFKTGSAESIAQSLKRSSTESRRRKGTPFQSAMSMLNFYINRAGRNLPKERRDILERAKRKLREAFGREP
jgi:hemerythrin-like domain-containing protein